MGRLKRASPFLILARGRAFFVLPFMAIVFALYLIFLFFQRTVAVSSLSFLLSGLFIYKFRRFWPFAFAFAIVFIILTQNLLLNSIPSYGFEREDIKAVWGRVESDSVMGKYESRRITLSLKECFIAGGNAATARGLISVTYPEGQRLYAGDSVLFYGHFNDYGFSATHYRVEAYSHLSRARGKILKTLENTITDGSREGLLSLMLLLGYSESEDFPLNTLARKSGTSYVLALSGMHLSLFALLVKKIFSFILSKSEARLVSIFLLSLYVILIGPKASILRAYILSVVFFLFARQDALEALIITFFIQLVFFPLTLVSLASTYSYLSLVGIMKYSESLARSVDEIILLPQPIISSVTASLAAVLFTAPLSYLVFGEYQLSVIITGFFVSPLIYIYMVISLFPFFPLLKKAVYGFLEFFMQKGASFPMAKSLFPYFITLALTLLLCLLSAMLKRRRDYVETELRKHKRDKGNYGPGRSGNDEKVWSEFSDEPLGQREDSEPH